MLVITSTKMNRYFNLVIAKQALGFISGNCNNKSAAMQLTEKKPNIIFILTDDQRWDAIGFAGNTIIHTLNIDQLAASGLILKMPL